METALQNEMSRAGCTCHRQSIPTLGERIFLDSEKQTDLQLKCDILQSQFGFSRTYWEFAPGGDLGIERLQIVPRQPRARRSDDLRRPAKGRSLAGSKCRAEIREVVPTSVGNEARSVFHATMTVN